MLGLFILETGNRQAVNYAPADILCQRLIVTSQLMSNTYVSFDTLARDFNAWKFTTWELPRISHETSVADIGAFPSTGPT